MLDAARSELLVIDLQTRLLPAIDGAAAILGNAVRLTTAARRLGIPVTFTEQYPRGLGPTAAELAPEPDRTLAKLCFDALADPAIAARLDPSDRTLVLAGCEAHVCVLQTALSLCARGRSVALVADATGSRSPANHRAALDRLARHGVELVTTEMVIFEWLGTAENPAFRELMALVK